MRTSSDFRQVPGSLLVLVLKYVVGDTYPIRVNRDCDIIKGFKTGASLILNCHWVEQVDIIASAASPVLMALSGDDVES